MHWLGAAARGDSGVAAVPAVAGGPPVSAGRGRGVPGGGGVAAVAGDGRGFGIDRRAEQSAVPLGPYGLNVIIPVGEEPPDKMAVSVTVVPPTGPPAPGVVEMAGVALAGTPVASENAAGTVTCGFSHR